MSDHIRIGIGGPVAPAKTLGQGRPVGGVVVFPFFFALVEHLEKKHHGQQPVPHRQAPQLLQHSQPLALPPQQDPLPRAPPPVLSLLLRPQR